MTVCRRIIFAGLLAMLPAQALAETLSRTAEDLMYQPVARVKGDPVRAMAEVKARVATEDYDGVAKGGLGAWITGGANSADQALLLAKLLANGRPGEARRFAWCTRSAAEEAALTGARGSKGTALDNAVALAWGMHDTALQAVLPDVLALRDETHAAAARFAGDLKPHLPALVKTAVPAGAARPHVWVQVEIAGTWTDFDPTTADGKPPCHATSVASALPAEWTQRVRISMMVETRVDGLVSETNALAQGFDLSAVQFSRVTVGFLEAMQPSENRSPSPAGLVTYTPVMMVDGELNAGTPFKMPLPGTSTSPKVEITGATLVFEFTGPGAPAAPFRSVVLDRIGPEARSYGDVAHAALSPMAIADSEYVPFATMWQVGILTGSTEGAALAALAYDIGTADGLANAVDHLIRLYPAMLHEQGRQPQSPMVVLAALSPEETGGRLTIDALSAPSIVGDAGDAAADGAAGLAAEQSLAALAGVGLRGAGPVFDAARKAGLSWVVLQPGSTPAVTGISGDALATLKQRLADGYTVLSPSSAPTLADGPAAAWWLFDPKTGLLRDQFEDGQHEASSAAEGVSEAPSWAERYRAIGCRLSDARMLVAMTALATTGGDDSGATLLTAARAAQGAWAKRVYAAKNGGTRCP